MYKGRNTALVVLIIIIILGAFLWYNRNATWLAPLLGSAPVVQLTESGVASYQCDAGKTIVATYYTGPASASTNTQPPTPIGSVSLTLGDGRNLTLPQTISGSGIRYANTDESVVFWSKGNTAFITEGAGASAPQTFTNCIATSNVSGQEAWNVYTSSSLGYSIKYPTGFTVTAPYTYGALGPGKAINGVKFTIDPSIASGTNLSKDSYVSVEQLPANAANCNASVFLDSQIGSTTVVIDNGVEYSMANGSGAGAGNRYDETVYAIPGSSQCTAIRYFIHSTAVGNYPVGTVKEFDKDILVGQFAGIRRSLTLSK